jgi:two-component system NarL family sensor kinase
MEQSLKEYAQRITQVQEEERKRIAYELHDDTAQYLSILKLQLDSLIHSGKIQDPEVIKKLGYLEKDAGRAVDDVRRYSHELRPGVLDHLGLRAALEQLADDINKLIQINAVLEVEGEELKLSDNIKLGLFRIAQEALSNARKHSKAKDVFIKLSFTDSMVKLTVADNGVGFEVSGAAVRSSLKGSLGLMSMQERAALIGADLKIESKPGAGTTITAEVEL